MDSRSLAEKLEGFGLAELDGPRFECMLSIYGRLEEEFGDQQSSFSSMCKFYVAVEWGGGLASEEDNQKLFDLLDDLRQEFDDEYMVQIPLLILMENTIPQCKDMLGERLLRTDRFFKKMNSF